MATAYDYRPILIMIVALVLVAGAVFSEPPEREDVAHSLLLTRHHWWEVRTVPQYGGLWEFDPLTGALSRLRPLSLTLGSGRVPDLPYRTGFGHLLATIDNRVVVQTWPFFLDIEAPSWRLLRRYPTTVGLEPLGWMVHGPVLSETEAEAVGLGPGLYGFASCILNTLTVCASPVSRYCEPFKFPGWAEPLYIEGDTSVVLYQSGMNELDNISFFGDVTPYRYFCENLPALTFDSETGGFWRVAPRTIEFLPVTSGVLGQASIVYEPEFYPLTDGDEWQFASIYLHPSNRTLFVTATNTQSGGSFFFSLDRDLSLLDIYDISSEPDIGWPISMTSLRAPPTTYEQTIPVVSNTPGRYGTTWTTDLWLFNPSGTSSSVSIRRVIDPEEERTVDLPAHGSILIEDALGWIGGGPAGDGTANDALVLTSPSRWSEEVVAVSRTFNPGTMGGTYGQAVPAVPGTLGYSNHLPYDPYFKGRDLYKPMAPGLRVSNLSLDPRVPDRFRHNLGIVNDGDEPVKLTLIWGWVDPQEESYSLYEYRPAENLRTVTVDPHAVRIVSLEKLFPAEVRDGWPSRLAVYGDRPAILWLSMVDNLTGDATFVPYTNFHYMVDLDDDRSVLPVVANNPGTLDTVWTTDVYGIQGNERYDRPLAFFHPQAPNGQCGGAAHTGEISAYLEGDMGIPLDRWIDTLVAIGFLWAPDSDRVEYGMRMVFPDVIHLFPECGEDEDVKGGLEVVTGSWTSGYSRTYTTRPDGGTYGGMLPLYPPHGWPVQHFAGIEVGGGFRINVGLFNGDHEHTITHRLTLYRADGGEAASVEFDLAPLELRQQSLARILDLPAGSLEEGTYGLTVLPLDDDETGVQGRSWAFVSLVDNVTGDPTNWW